ncbi:MAG TPA: TetR/AcrR family transcriptional regulator [Acidimicrobiia bacterium]
MAANPKAGNTKSRILDATAELFMRYGYTGTGLKQIVADANAPFGSLYHHFPGGKEELGVEVIHRSGAMYLELVSGVIDAAPDLLSGVRDCFAGAAEVLRATDYADACPIETVALEVASTNEPLREATAQVFESWIDGAFARFRAADIDEPTARELSITLIALLEGAFVLCRASRTTEALEAAGNTAAIVVEAALRGRAT